MTLHLKFQNASWICIFSSSVEASPLFAVILVQKSKHCCAHNEENLLEIWTINLNRQIFCKRSKVFSRVTSMTKFFFNLLQAISFRAFFLELSSFLLLPFKLSNSSFHAFNPPDDILKRSSSTQAAALAGLRCQPERSPLVQVDLTSSTCLTQAIRRYGLQHK